MRDKKEGSLAAETSEKSMKVAKPAVTVRVRRSPKKLKVRKEVSESTRLGNEDIMHVTEGDLPPSKINGTVHFFPACISVPKEGT